MQHLQHLSWLPKQLMQRRQRRLLLRPQPLTRHLQMKQLLPSRLLHHHLQQRRRRLLLQQMKRLRL